MLDIAEVEERVAARAREISLAHLSTNPSCFLRALSSLSLSQPPAPSSSCPSSAPVEPCDFLSDPDKGDKVRGELAVRMALCEIGTAGAKGEGEKKVPRECEEWEAGWRTGRKKGKVGRSGEDRALSRSPQYWSSYSGYLREIVTLCSTLSRWSDLSLARSLHRETSLLMRGWAEEVRAWERERAGRERAEGERRERDGENLDIALASLTALHSSLTATSSALSSTFDESALSLSLASASLVAQLTALEEGMRGVIEKVGTEMNGLVSGMGTGLKSSLQAHDGALSAIAASTSERLASSLDTLEAKEAGLAQQMDGLSMTVQAVGADLQLVNSSHISGLHSSSLAEASQLQAVLANLTRLAEEQQVGLFERFSAASGRSGWSVGGHTLGLEDVVWVGQVLWSIARYRVSFASLSAYLLVYSAASYGFSSSVGLPPALST
ncbi:hypothetical protein JCM11251_007439 [Rhodosporidiobolus azoricus]